MSILEPNESSGVSYKDFTIISADYTNGTTAEATLRVGDMTYTITMHNTKKLDEEEAKEIFLKNLDALAILSARYLFADNKSMTYNASANKVIRERKVKDMAAGSEEVKSKETAIDMDNLGEDLDVKLQSTRLKKYVNLPPVKGGEEKEKSKEKEKEVSDSDEKSPSSSKSPQTPQQVKSQKFNEKVYHIQEAIRLYNLLKSGGAAPSLPFEGEILIEAEEAPKPQERDPEELRIASIKKGWEEEGRILSRALEKRKGELEPEKYAAMAEEIEKVREEAIEGSLTSTGWGLGSDLANTLQGDPVSKEA